MQSTLDEGSWKLWDIRMSLSRPCHHGNDDFQAGVTVLSPHPRRDHLLAVGSYDETIALFDLRRMVTKSNSSNKRPETLCRSDPLGGGVWRCKWHPFEDDRLLVAAMHGGCVVGNFDGMKANGYPEEGKDALRTISFDVQKKFTLHNSMAYGTDWLVYPRESITSNARHKGVEAAASCSFYDRAMYLWETNAGNN